VLYEAKLPLRQLMRLDIGDTLQLEFAAGRSGHRSLWRCDADGRPHGSWSGDRVAVRVAKAAAQADKTTLAMFEGTEGATNRMEGS